MAATTFDSSKQKVSLTLR